MQIEYIKKSTLEWKNLWEDFGMEKYNGGRWYPAEDTPDYAVEFLDGYRAPSRAHPYSYAKPLLTQKFAKIVCEKDPELAVEVGIARKIEAAA